MPASFDRARSAAHDESWKGAVGMPVAVADASAEEQDRVVEQRSLAVGRRLQLLKVVGEEFDVIGLDLRALLHLLGLVLMVSQRMVRFGHADLRIWAAVL